MEWRRGGGGPIVHHKIRKEIYLINHNVIIKNVFPDFPSMLIIFLLYFNSAYKFVLIQKQKPYPMARCLFGNLCSLIQYNFLPAVRLYIVPFYLTIFTLEVEKLLVA